MKKILLIATGGTIASQQTEHGLAPLILPETFLRHVPGIRTLCEVDTVQILNLDSTNLRPQHWLLMAKTIRENYNHYDGFVVCHGTDTMSYTAAALSYLIQHSPKPIVLTGSQRPIDREDTDARSNLYGSFLYAVSPYAHDVVLVFDGKVIAGTRARKIRTKSYNAFDSINFPYLASIQGDKIISYISNPPTNEMPAFFDHLNQKVFLLKLIPGLEEGIFSYLEDKYDALILESYGVGGIPSDTDYNFSEEIHRLIEHGMTVVMATQVIHEGSDMTVYQVGHRIKEQYGLLESFDMTLEAVVTKLMWILAQTRDQKEISRLFHTTVNYDMLFRP